MDKVEMLREYKELILASLAMEARIKTMQDKTHFADILPRFHKAIETALGKGVKLG